MMRWSASGWYKSTPLEDAAPRGSIRVGATRLAGLGRVGQCMSGAGRRGAAWHAETSLQTVLGHKWCTATGGFGDNTRTRDLSQQLTFVHHAFRAALAAHNTP
ncbi:hypothetical protein E2C01_024747 [Portunus trituberculatus]|uniref:Uncharacterized protein n=1 Tax=Portunus trituberculatus TaxID=210409 RepID=A0A5B7EDP9_PORTR|nr:hypothetical protein [Portunus trituberculatus]